MVVIRHRRAVLERGREFFEETPVLEFVLQQLLVRQHPAPQLEADAGHPRAATSAVQVVREGRVLPAVTEADRGSTDLAAGSVGKQPEYPSNQNLLP